MIRKQARLLLLFSLAAVFLFPSCSATSTASVSPEQYHIYTGTVDAENQITYNKLPIPDTINGWKTAFAGIIDRSNVVLLLYSEPGNALLRIWELGIYHLESGEYSSELSFSENQAFGICALNESHLILRLSTDNWRTAGIYSYAFQKKELRKVYSYSINADIQAVVVDNNNSILLTGDTLWFDDYYLNDSDEIRIDAYKYDLSKSELSKIRTEAQNPLLYHGKMYYFVKNERNEYKLLQSLDGSSTIVIEEEWSGIASSNAEIFCIENKSIHVSQLTEIIMNTPILSTTYPISQLQASEYFVTWTNYYDEIPCVYDVKARNMLVFSELTEGLSTFFLKDNFGIFVHTHNDVNDYYWFETMR